MSVTRTIHPKYPHEFQAISRLDQDPPVQNTWYTVFDGTGGLRLRFLSSRQRNDEAAAKDVEFRMTIDGVSVDSIANSHDNLVWYYWNLEPGIERVTTGVFMFHHYVAVECHDALIEMRMTSAPGTDQRLDGRLHYETLERLPG